MLLYQVTSSLPETKMVVLPVFFVAEELIQIAIMYLIRHLSNLLTSCSYLERNTYCILGRIRSHLAKLVFEAEFHYRVMAFFF